MENVHGSGVCRAENWQRIVEGSEARSLEAMQSLKKQGSSVGVSIYLPHYTCIYPISVRGENVSVSECVCLHFQL